VICIKKGQRISDKASLRFSRVLYETLFVKNYNVCTSFEIAKEEVRKVINSTEANKFLLFIQRSDTPETHKCFAVPNLKPGDIINVDKHAIFRSIPASVECFLGRQKEIDERINLI